mmetsp:Transcript_21938/g.32691  ORF Transcript_21938/g.32691 Transcript_21938/m.32691 type:complete len:527 (-) Transcript_21938:85-1665(-)
MHGRKRRTEIVSDQPAKTSRKSLDKLSEGPDELLCCINGTEMKKSEWERIELVQRTQKKNVYNFMDEKQRPLMQRQLKHLCFYDKHGTDMTGLHFKITLGPPIYERRIRTNSKDLKFSYPSIRKPTEGTFDETYSEEARKLKTCWSYASANGHPLIIEVRFDHPNGESEWRTVFKGCKFRFSTISKGKALYRMRIVIGNTYKKIPETKAKLSRNSRFKKIHEWQLYVKAKYAEPNQTLNAERDIIRVTFTMDSSFEPRDFVKNFPPFKTKQTTYDTLAPKITIQFSDGCEKIYRYDIELSEGGNEDEHYYTLRTEKRGTKQAEYLPISACRLPISLISSSSRPDEAQWGIPPLEFLEKIMKERDMQFADIILTTRSFEQRKKIFAQFLKYRRGFFYLFHNHTKKPLWKSLEENVDETKTKDLMTSVVSSIDDNCLSSILACNFETVQLTLYDNIFLHFRCGLPVKEIPKSIFEAWVRFFLTFSWNAARFRNPSPFGVYPQSARLVAEELFRNVVKDRAIMENLFKV